MSRKFVRANNRNTTPSFDNSDTPTVASYTAVTLQSTPPKYADNLIVSPIKVDEKLNMNLSPHNDKKAHHVFNFSPSQPLS